MGPDAGRYGRSFADVYDTWYAEVPTDDLLAFIGERATPNAEVLEVGVGTGRVALALAAVGFVVTGIDSSPEMLHQLRSKPGADQVATVLADAADDSSYSPDSADVVLGVFNLLFNLIGDGDQARCLAGCARALRPGGFMVIEAFVPDRVTERRRDLVTRSVDGERAVLIATDADPVTQTIHGGHVEITEAGTRLRPWVVRVADHHRIDEMADAAGLMLVERFADFGGARFIDGESTHHVSVYRHA